jgi:hypothetical protein
MLPARRTRHKRSVRAKLIQEFRRTGRVDLAAAAAGCDRDSHYLWLKSDPEYAAEFEAAREQVAGLLEDEAVRRATKGTLKPVSIGGQLHFVYEFSDRLLEFLLKCRNRPVFGDRQELTGANGTALIPERVGTDEAIAAYKASKSEA